MSASTGGAPFGRVDLRMSLVYATLGISQPWALRSRRLAARGTRLERALICALDSQAQPVAQVARADTAEAYPCWGDRSSIIGVCAGSTTAQAAVYGDSRGSAVECSQDHLVRRLWAPEGGAATRPAALKVRGRVVALLRSAYVRAPIRTFHSRTRYARARATYRMDALAVG